MPGFVTWLADNCLHTNGQRIIQEAPLFRKALGLSLGKGIELSSGMDTSR
jgi:hypothetical protein